MFDARGYIISLLPMFADLGRHLNNTAASALHPSLQKINRHTKMWVAIPYYKICKCNLSVLTW
jgi:hypothetical protein